MSGKRQLVIIGAGGHGKVVGEIAELSGQYASIVYLDNNHTLKTCLGYPVAGKTDCLGQYPQADVFVAIGDNAVRQKVTETVDEKRLVSLVHPSAVVSERAVLGRGTVVMAQAVVGVEAQVGAGCVINTAATIDHECKLGEFVHVSPGVHVGGQTALGDRTWLGVGVSVIHNIAIGHDVLVGAGGVVVRDLPQPGTYVGVPVKKLATMSGVL